MPPEPAATWRRLHPVTILRELLGVAWNLVVAVIVLGALQGGGADRFEVLIPIVFFAVAVGRYYSTRYLITPDAVLWRRGILFRRRLEVPRSRIQNVSSGADVLGRIFGLRTVTVSTAGSEGEIELALVSSEEASFLLADLLGRSVPDGGAAPGAPTVTWPAPDAGDRPATGATPPPGDVPPPAGGSPPAGAPPPLRPSTAGPPATPPPPVRRLVSLSTGDLVVYAVTGGGLRVLVAALAGTVLVAVGAGSWRPLLFLVAAVAAPVMATLDLVDFELTAEADRLRVRHGLLKTRDKWARRERVQVLRVDRPVLRSALGYETVSVATADASVGGDSDLSLCSPLARRGRWPELAGELLEAPAVTESGLQGISPRAELRRFLRVVLAVWLPAGVAVAVLAAVADGRAALGAAAVAVLLGLMAARVLARRAQRLDGFAMDDRHLLLRRGMVASRLWLVRRAKVQSVVVHASPFQRRLGLASLLVDTANVGGGSMVIPDLPRRQAEEVASELVEHADRVFLPDGV